MLGTPLYMSPEQARGSEDVDDRADIWASALILYECLTGEVPFRGNNYLGVISQVLTRTCSLPRRCGPSSAFPRPSTRGHARAGEGSRAALPAMAELERDMERLLAGDMDAGFEDGASAAPGPASASAAAGPWHLAVAAIFALGIGTAVVLARGSSDASGPAGPAGPDGRQGRAAGTRTVPKIPAPPRPAPRAAAGRRPASTCARPGKAHLGSSGDESPRSPSRLPAKKTKADDKIAPSPYTAPKAP